MRRALAALRIRLIAFARALLARARTDPAGILFTGTGCSSTLPLVRCAIDGNGGCACAVALRNGRGDPNWRGNVGAVLRFVGADGTAQHVQIDVGKSWREAAVRWFPTHGIRRIDGVLLTHEHADASLGLDDLRSLQMKSALGTASSVIPVFADLRSLKKIRAAFPYLFPPPPRLPDDAEGDSAPGSFALTCACCEEQPWPQPASAMAGDMQATAAFPPTFAGTPTLTGRSTKRKTAAPPPDAATTVVAAPPASAAAPSAAPAARPAAPAAPLSVVRFVAKLDWRCFGADVSAGPEAMSARASTMLFTVAGLRVTPLPVMHGEDYVSYGFGMGEAGGRLVYISDYTRILPQTMELLERWSAPGAHRKQCGERGCKRCRTKRWQMEEEHR
jgi:hypothetical protein